MARQNVIFFVMLHYNKKYGTEFFNETKKKYQKYLNLN